MDKKQFFIKLRYQKKTLFHFIIDICLFEGRFIIYRYPLSCDMKPLLSISAGIFRNWVRHMKHEMFSYRGGAI